MNIKNENSKNNSKTKQYTADIFNNYVITLSLSLFIKYEK